MGSRLSLSRRQQKRYVNPSWTAGLIVYCTSSSLRVHDGYTFHFPWSVVMLWLPTESFTILQMGGVWPNFFQAGQQPPPAHHGTKMTPDSCQPRTNSKTSSFASVSSHPRGSSTKATHCIVTSSAQSLPSHSGSPLSSLSIF